MTKIKIGGQKYSLEELPESFRNRIKSELDKEGIKYDEEDDKIKLDGNGNKKSEVKIEKKTDKKEKKTDKQEKKTDKQEKKKEKKTDMSLFRKMFGYP